MVNVFFQATIDFNGLSMVLTLLHHHHRMFFEGPTIGVNGFSMVFKILRAMVNNGFEVNDGLDVSFHLEVHKSNSRLGSATEDILTLTRCQDHILTENLWFVWSKTSYRGDKRKCHYAGRQTTKN